MAKIKLNLSKLNLEDKITLGNNIKTSLTTNVAVFATPNPTVTAYGTLITTLTAKNATVVALRSQLAAAMGERDVAERAFDAGTNQLSAYVDNIANGDAVKIGQAGMGVRADKTPVGIPGQVQSLAITAGDAEGELELQWDPVFGAKTYDVQISPDPFTASSWLPKPSVTKSKASVPGLTSGQKMWARVRAVGAGGQGAWSDPATKMVP